MAQCFTERDAWYDTFRLCSGMHCAQASGIAKRGYCNEPMLDSLLSEPTAASAPLAAPCTTLQLLALSISCGTAWALRSMSLMLAQLLCSAKLIAVQPCISQRPSGLSLFVRAGMT